MVSVTQPPVSAGARVLEDARPTLYHLGTHRPTVSSYGIIPSALLDGHNCLPSNASAYERPKNGLTNVAQCVVGGGNQRRGHRGVGAYEVP